MVRGLTMPKLGKAIASVFCTIISVAIGALVYSYAISLFKMENIIVFSAPIITVMISTPLLVYVFSAGIIEFSFGQKSIFFKILMKYNKFIMRFLLYLSVAGFFISIPVSFLVNIHLLDNGYKTCDRISWRSPTTYVKDLSLCGR